MLSISSLSDFDFALFDGSSFPVSFILSVVGIKAEGLFSFGSIGSTMSIGHLGGLGLTKGFSTVPVVPGQEPYIPFFALLSVSSSSFGPTYAMGGS
jgi:hypothetical protein